MGKQQSLNILHDSFNGHWNFPKDINEFPENIFGFVYLITNMTNNKRYIGCKQTGKLIKRKPLKGKKKKRIEKTDSDWRTYTGSSSELNKDIEKLGKSNFKFDILNIAFSKSELKLKELLYQLSNNVMFDKTFYNSMINVRLSSIKLPGFKFNQSDFML